MRKKITLLFVAAFFLFTYGNAQIVWIEDFDYPANTPLVANPVVSEANYDDLTHWWTARNDRTEVLSLMVTDSTLVYDGYSDGVGNSLAYDGTNGPGYHKAFVNADGDTIRFLENSTLYISFLINFSDIAASGTDYFMGIKMDLGPGSFNWGGRVFAKNDMFTNGKVDIGINKSDSPGAEWYSVSNDGALLEPNETHLFVIRYDIGDVAESREAQDAADYEWDDVMRVYINPDLTQGEPEAAHIHHEDPGLRDIRRWGATTIFGGGHAVYKRTPAEGTAPTYVMDAIRVGHTWEDVVPRMDDTSIAFEVINSRFDYYVRNKQIYVANLDQAFSSYRVIGLTGQTMLSGNLNSNSSQINASDLETGIYILQLYGGSDAAAVKVLLK